MSASLSLGAWPVRRGRIINPNRLDGAPCQHCGKRYATENGSLARHEEKCYRNPVRKPPTLLLAPCSCGRTHKSGAPYMTDQKGGPCWKCYREQYPDPDLADLTERIQRGDETPRIVPEILQLKAQCLSPDVIADRLCIDVESVIRLAARYKTLEVQGVPLQGV